LKVFLNSILVKILFLIISIFKLEAGYKKFFIKIAIENFFNYLDENEDFDLSKVNIDAFVICYCYMITVEMPNGELRNNVTTELIKELSRKAKWHIKNQ
jgi:hypothetical protein